ncbi:uncharacterized protein C2845_PM15G03680 [Panicum miliaceum]|uniref:DUF6598 domain-containing protein n=1 Tax=Panicum miliaceum TaxID=4540 RepID=A0A3L6QBN6_PANMI|nr:uncharacterized protein C2845_PM15G03680 [Panicum miliaceum]
MEAKPSAAAQSPLIVGDIEKQSLEIEAGGSNPARGKKRPPSPPDGDEEPSMDTPSDDDNEWIVSDNDHHENQGADHFDTLVHFPKASCDYDEQNHILYTYPNIELRGPSPIRLYPAFKSDMHVFRSDYNLHDKSEISITSVRDCPTKCQCLPMFLIQFIDINIAGYHHARPGPARIYGFVAARDAIEPLRNYVYGMAHLSLTSPARVISMVARALIEFELCVRTEERPEDEPKGDCLIEGCTEFTNLFSSDSYIEHRRLYGNNCALDVKFAVLINAVEARIDVEVLRLGAISSSINLKVYAKTSGFKEVIRLFEDAAPKPGTVMSFVAAVETKNYFDLYIEGSPGDNPVLGQKEKQVLHSWWKCRFGSSYHRLVEEVAELGGLPTLEEQPKVRLP